MKEILLSGSGGQGVILAGIILAEAGLIEDKEIVQTQSYGPEARGGACKAEVIMDNEPISFPHIDKPDIVLAMTQEAFNKYTENIKDNGIIISNSTFVKDTSSVSCKVVEAPITSLAIEKVGKDLFSNIIALGVLVGATDIIEFDSLKKAILGRVPKGTEDANLKALEIGFDIGKAS
ncbi:MAG: 2-oxoglutarate ferredoxin oxidoreductase subunit gamma [Clostridia bacterium]|jgi:2-oxoglutarate ferredoxin oxidoreductase subunit gamma|nr:2-oxoglutarate ferredoxin oxidoreductase subunit gamma [Clostridia bacterium]MDN5322182.1 2-oxoglutarate ferredoxin oxidoreductase subunit gamma [Clostridia bacterium]